MSSGHGTYKPNRANDPGRRVGRQELTGMQQLAENERRSAAPTSRLSSPARRDPMAAKPFDPSQGSLSYWRNNS